MVSMLRGRPGAALVAFFLLLQLGILWASVSGYEQISIFCTGPATSNLSWVFGARHLLFLALFVMGLLSIRATALRVPYLALLTVALIILPVQASLVHRHALSCDAP
jgi:hypothetical protein